MFGLLVAASGLMLASHPVTWQGMALAATGVIGLVFAGLRAPRPAWPGGRLAQLMPRPSGPASWAMPVGALVLVATTVESAQPGLSPWTPLGLLTGVALLAVPIRALPASDGPPRTRREPNAAVVLVVIALVFMVGYEALRHLLTPEPGDLPSYLAAVGMPFVAALGAGALAVLAASRGGLAGVSAAGGLALAWAGLYLARNAGDTWQARQVDLDNVRLVLQHVTPGTEWSSAYQSSAYASAVAIGFSSDDGAETVLVILGLVLVTGGWWWAAARRRAG
jgi:hypothetical protein